MGRFRKSQSEGREEINDVQCHKVEYLRRRRVSWGEIRWKRPAFRFAYAVRPRAAASTNGATESPFKIFPSWSISYWILKQTLRQILKPVLCRRAARCRPDRRSWAAGWRRWRRPTGRRKSTGRRAGRCRRGRPPAAPWSVGRRRTFWSCPWRRRPASACWSRAAPPARTCNRRQRAGRRRYWTGSAPAWKPRSARSRCPAPRSSWSAALRPGPKSTRSRSTT